MQHAGYKDGHCQLSTCTMRYKYPEELVTHPLCKTIAEMVGSGWGIGVGMNGRKLTPSELRKTTGVK